ncbi:hypothetical protein C8Q75DRAFT_228126 [Abortiporus biennis]|nr:hypothetical protein C8Q75DRAFT_228126 [Abortiporus biennis]
MPARTLSSKPSLLLALRKNASRLFLPATGQITFYPASHSLVQCLPSEVILAICGELVSSLITNSNNDNDTISDDTADAIPSLLEAQRSLYGAVISCKAWYLSASSLLYIYPYLLSVRRLRLFARTLRQCPNLIQFVKGMFLLDPQRKKQSLFYRSIMEMTRQEQKIKKSKACLNKVLELCTSLEFLHLHNHGGKSSSVISVDDNFKSSCPGKHIRYLTLFGYDMGKNGDSWSFDPTTPFVGGKFRQIEFPSLEILSLRKVRLGKHFPALIAPNMHTLQITESSRYYHPAPLEIDPSKFPSLNTVEFYNNRVGCSLHVPIELVRRLKRVHLINCRGSRPWDMFRFEETMNKLTAIESMVIGGLWLEDHEEEEQGWMFPDGLDQLKVIHRFRDDEESCAFCNGKGKSPFQVAETLCKTLRRGSAVVDGISRGLRKEIVLQLIGQGPNTGTFSREEMEIVKAMFAEKGVKFTLDRDTTLDWIAERLAVPHTQ